MHVLRTQLGRLETLTSFVKKVAENPAAQGVVVDINPIWERGYALHRAGLGPHAFWWGEGGTFASQSAFTEGDYFDFDWADQSDTVANLTAQMAGREIPAGTLPFVVKVVAKPTTESLVESRDQLVSLVREQPFFAFVETRPLGVLAAAAGDSCQANGVPGTIGGFLRDQKTNKVFAATCGHVAAHLASVAIPQNQHVICRHSHPPSQMPVNQYCALNAPCVNQLDFALLDVGGCGVVSNHVSGPAAQIASHQIIQMRRNGTTQPYEVGGTVLTYSPGNSNVCFGNLFEVRPRQTGGVLNPKLVSAFATVPTQGDSGAWIETTQGQKWAGVLVAADHLMGYALEADDVLREADATFGTKLVVV